MPFLLVDSSSSGAETRKKAKQLAQTCTCFCGKMFATSTAKAVHAFKVHGVVSPTCRFAYGSNACLNCLLQFSTRNGLIEHLQCGTRLCLLNTHLRVAPTTDLEDIELRAKAQKFNLNW